ncbi:MAG TPA: AMP-binding protein, partial [Methylomirabilota bacterium]|nr:AMP-binding protein [Methylomirabilota bacterium]
MTLAGLLERAALRHPDAEAVVDGGARLTYATLDARARSLGRTFARLGVGRGDRVLIVLKNRLEHVLAYWALQTIAGVPVPVNFRLAAGEIAYVLADSGARLVLFEPATATAVLEATRDRDVTLIFVGRPDAKLTNRPDILPFDSLEEPQRGTGGGGEGGGEEPLTCSPPPVTRETRRWTDATMDLAHRIRG